MQDENAKLNPGLP